MAVTFSTSVPFIEAEFGRRLKRVLRTNAAFELIPWAEGWTSGGCWVLAEALYRYLHPNVRKVAMVGPNGVDHVLVVTKTGIFFDGDGASTRSGLLKRWANLGYPRMRLEPFSSEAAEQRGITCHAWHPKEAESFLRKRLGPPPFVGGSSH